MSRHRVTRFGSLGASNRAGCGRAAKATASSKLPRLRNVAVVLGGIEGRHGAFHWSCAVFYFTAHVTPGSRDEHDPSPNHHRRSNRDGFAALLSRSKGGTKSRQRARPVISRPYRCSWHSLWQPTVRASIKIGERMVRTNSDNPIGVPHSTRGAPVSPTFRCGRRLRPVGTAVAGKA
jgi:hypothetical protein